MSSSLDTGITSVGDDRAQEPEFADPQSRKYPLNTEKQEENPLDPLRKPDKEAAAGAFADGQQP